MKRKNKFACALILFTLFAATSASAETKSEKSTGGKRISGIAAIVNDNIVTETEVEKAIRMLKGPTLIGDSDARREIINRLVDDMLFDQLVSAAKIEISDDDLARAIAGVLQENRISLDQLRNELAGKGMTYEDYKANISKEIKRVKYVNQVIGPQVKITDQDLRDYYQKNQEQFRGTHSAHIAEIVLPLDGITSQAEFNSLRDLALSISSNGKKGGAFEQLAQKHSKGPNPEKGGDLGMVDLSTLPVEVSSTVRTMKIGDVSSPILSGNAIVVVKLISLPEISAADFDRLRDKIYEALYDAKIDETMASYLAKERQKAFIEIR